MGLLQGALSVLALAGGAARAGVATHRVGCGAGAFAKFLDAAAPFDHDVVIELHGVCTERMDLHRLLQLRASPAHHVTLRGGVHSGGVHLDAGRWVPAAMPSGAAGYTYNLTGLGIEDYGSFVNGGLGHCAHTKLELFADGYPMTLARHPNVNSSSAAGYNGPWMEWSYAVADPAAANASFVTSDAALAALMKGNPRGNRVWAHGFWHYGWADNYVEVLNATVAGAGARLAFNASTPPVYDTVLPGAKFYAVNAPALLDAPGEYWIDEAAETLYYIPPSHTALGSAYLNVGTGPLIAIPPNTANLTLEDLAVTHGRGVGIAGAGLTDVTVRNVTATHLGQDGVTFSGATRCTFDGIAVAHTGCRAAYFEGGDAATLDGAGTRVTNGDMGFYSRRTRTYQPGIFFGGVGLTFVNNSIHDAPHQGMSGGGNDMLIEKNAFRRLCWEVTDSSAFYIGRSWVHRGGMVRGNYFEDVVHIEPTHLGAPSIQAMYLDDEQSGWALVDNVVVNAMAGVLVGGGRDNNVTGNQFRQIQTYAIHFDNRGMGWQLAMCSPGGLLRQQLYDVDYQRPPYATAYPKIVGTLEDRPCVPVGNVFENNHASECPPGYKGLIDRTPDVVASWSSVWGANNTSC
eukprot:TRINITY_DN3013_c2_g1_i2.p2 TRINITY_DN3013_c2_g1~~TRINITY_DN3013_c2_g1_i2.p2  ORF type:complete len:628 (+),score=238.67 TRINITY_DN3013_c2_g1_i2:44-1927(+)